MPIADVTSGNEGIMIPDFDTIVSKCIHELNIKYEAYGNSWITEPDGYWIKRMTNELDEFTKAMTEVAAKRKLLNLINMAAMCFDTYKMPEKCSKCGK